MASPTIQFKRGAVANLPGLKPGEPAFTTDNFDFYVGLDTSTANNKFFGSHRYWTKETNLAGSGVNLVESTSQGTQYITLKSPDSLAGIVTYTFPGDDGSANQVLATDGAGQLFFADASAEIVIQDNAATVGVDTISLLTDILTFAGTSSEIETAVTNNQVQIGLPDNVIVGASLTVTSALDVDGGADISGGETVLSSATVSDLTSGRVVLAGTAGALGDNANLTFDGSVLDVTGNITVSGTVDGRDVLDDGQAGDNLVTLTGVARDAVDLGTFTGTTITDSSTIKTALQELETSLEAQDLDIAGDSGTGAIDLDTQSLTVAGTANEIETSAANQTITVGLPDAVTVTSSVTTVSVKATNVQANDGTTSLTLSNSTGNVEAAANLTVQGNLIVNGSTTQVNTSQTTIEDQLLELGMVDGSAPSSDLNKDIGVVFNYFTASAKKAAVYWDDSTSRIVLSDDVSETTGVLTPTTYAGLEVGSLWVNDCAGQSQVINCSGTTRTLDNITIDGGAF